MSFIGAAKITHFNSGLFILLLFLYQATKEKEYLDQIHSKNLNFRYGILTVTEK